MDKHEFIALLEKLIKLETQIDLLHQKLIECKDKRLNILRNKQSSKEQLMKEMDKIKGHLEEALKKSNEEWKKTPLATRQIVGKIINKELTIEQGIERLQKNNIISN